MSPAQSVYQHLPMLISAVALSCANPAAAGEFELINLNGFEDCPLAYPDLDADGYGGATGVGHRCDPLPPNQVRQGGDCDDTRPEVYVGAFEPEPDSAFADENCDGVDGNVDLAIFASDTNTFPPPCGTRTTPCTLIDAIAVAEAAGKTQLYLSTGSHTGPLTLSGAEMTLRVFGGYSNQFRARAPIGLSFTAIQGALVPDIGAFTVEVSAGADLRLYDLRLVAPDVTAQTVDGDGLSSYGARALDGASLSTERVEVLAGNGAAGTAGSTGISASPLVANAAMNGGLGGDGDEYESNCDATNKGAGGTAGVNSCSFSPSSRPMNGGEGGAGGTMDTNCGPFGSCNVGGNCDARPGINGLDAAYTSGTAGEGGTGGSGLDSCGPTTGGNDGLIVDGNPGQAITGFQIAAGEVFAFAGEAGGTGENGSGGGGGGGAGGCDDGTDAYGAGGGGGGAGGCAAQTPGSGGRAGGASIGIAVFNASLTTVNTEITTQDGGAGGDGGNGGMGQSPGFGMTGGLPVGGATPGHGGNGMRGGHSGAGAGGGGGSSFGVLGLNAILNVDAEYHLGNPGPGGAGGLGPEPGLDGSAGHAGEQSTIRICANPAAC